MQTTESFTCYARFSSGSLVGTSFGGGQIALIVGIIAIAAGAALFAMNRKKHTKTSEE
jgi:LPXTG-motif cell wall-anchored protein